jgi:hypothetical protein
MSMSQETSGAAYAKILPKLPPIWKRVEDIYRTRGPMPDFRMLIEYERLYGRVQPRTTSAFRAGSRKVRAASSRVVAQGLIGRRDDLRKRGLVGEMGYKERDPLTNEDACVYGLVEQGAKVVEWTDKERKTDVTLAAIEWADEFTPAMLTRASRSTRLLWEAIQMHKPHIKLEKRRCRA